MTKASASPRLHALLCALIVTISALASLPFADVGINDDWSYIWSARTLAQTGHIVYVGWASAMLGWQLPLGALFIKLFGSSFFTPRASIILLSALTAFILQRTCARLGLSERNATFATLTFVLSPLFLPLGTSFMSDVPGIFCTALCLYLCTRSITAQADRSAFIWLALAALCSVVGGTARQTAWLCVIVMVPSTFWLIRHRRPPWIAALVLWLASLFIIFGTLRWFSHQLYSLHESAIVTHIDRDVVYGACVSIARALVELGFLLLPLSIAFPRHFPYRNRSLVFSTGVAVLLLGLVAIYLGRSIPPEKWLVPFQLFGNYVSPHGLADMPEIGIHPVVLSPWLQGVMTVATFASTVALIAFAIDRRKRKKGTIPQPIVRTSLTWHQVMLLMGPFCAAYCLLLVHRALFSTVYDRYLLPLLPFALIVLLRFYQESVAPTLPAASFMVLGLFAIFGIAGTHDVFAQRRALLAAAAELIAAGVPSTSFYGGYEYDGWTQVTAMGFANTGGILMPDGVHYTLPIARRMRLKPCDNYFAFMTPSIQPKYAISLDPNACDGSSSFPPVTYRAWLPPFQRQLYIRKVTRPAF